MATLRNKRKLAAVSREIPESTRNGRAPNVLDPELTQEYISQVSEEIEGRVTKKLSKQCLAINRLDHLINCSNINRLRL